MRWCIKQKIKNVNEILIVCYRFKVVWFYYAKLRQSKKRREKRKKMHASKDKNDLQTEQGFFCCLAFVYGFWEYGFAFYVVARKRCLIRKMYLFDVLVHESSRGLHRVCTLCFFLSFSCFYNTFHDFAQGTS